MNRSARPAPGSSSLFALTVVAAACNVFVPLADAALAPDQFAVQRALQPPGAPRGEIGRFYLDPAVMDLADERFSNLRVFDDAGAETPFLIRRSIPVRLVTRKVLFPTPTPVRSFRELPDNRAELTVERDSRSPEVAEIRIESAVRNFEKLVTVHGSTDGQTWDLLAKDEPIYDYSRFVDVRKDTIPVARGPYTRYRIEMGNITERKDSPLVNIVRQTRGGDSETESTSFLRQPFRMERLLFIEQRDVTATDSEAVETNTFMAAALNVATDNRKHQTILTMDAGGRPVTLLTLLTDDVNFSRVIRLEGCRVDTPNTWQRLADGRVTSIRAGRIHEDALTVAFPETRCRRLRLTIDNEDNPPITVTGVSLRENRYEGLFFPKSTRRYLLAFGGQGFDVPRYDVAAVLAPVPSGSADLWTLSDIGVSAPETTRRWGRPSSRTVLVAVLVVMATVLAVIVARLARHVDTQHG